MMWSDTTCYTCRFKVLPQYLCLCAFGALLIALIPIMRTSAHGELFYPRMPVVHLASHDCLRQQFLYNKSPLVVHTSSRQVVCRPLIRLPPPSFMCRKIFCPLSYETLHFNTPPYERRYVQKQLQNKVLDTLDTWHHLDTTHKCLAAYTALTQSLLRNCCNLQTIL